MLSLSSRQIEIRGEVGGGYAQTFDFTRTGTEQLTTSVALFRGVCDVLFPFLSFYLPHLSFSSLFVLSLASLNLPFLSFSLPLIYFLSRTLSLFLSFGPPLNSPVFGVGPFVQDIADVVRPYAIVSAMLNLKKNFSRSDNRVCS